MNKESLLQIGELAKISGVSVQALRYYEKLNLVKPAFVDEKTGYRYYVKEDVFLVRNIVMLKSAGFSLKEIIVFLKKKSIDEIELLYKDKINTFNREIEKIKNKKAEISYYLDFLSSLKNGKFEFNENNIGEILIKEMQECFVVFVRDIISFDYPSLMFLYNRVLKKVFENNLKVDNTLFAIFHSGYNNLLNEKSDIELTLTVQNGINIDRDCIKKRKASKVLSCLHKGKYPSCVPVYERMLRYADENGYTVSSPPVHRLVVPIAAVNNSDEIVFEIIQGIS